MKPSAFRLLCLAVAAMPMLAAAQSNIQSAFNAIIKCRDAEVTETHALERDPETGIKTAQCDIYNFTIIDDKMSLINKLVSAFNKDSKNAYSINSGKAASEGPTLAVAIGEDNNNSAQITYPGCEYIYALFLAPESEDPTGNFRYAYALCYDEKKGKITGRLTITYATTLKYRQRMAEEKQLKFLSGYAKDNLQNFAEENKPSWFQQLMSYVQAMTSADTQTRIALATKAYEHIKNIKTDSSVTESDKRTAREIFRGMISSSKYSDRVLNTLLRECESEIK